MLKNMNPSKAFQLNKDDLKKMAKGLALAMGGAGTVYLLGVVNAIDVDAFSPLYVGLAAALLNALKLWIQGQTN